MIFKVAKIQTDENNVIVDLTEKLDEGRSSSSMTLRLSFAAGELFKIGEVYEFDWLIVPPPGIKSVATLSFTGTALTDGDTVTVGVQTYTFRTVITEVPNEVLIGAVTDSMANLKAAVNGADGIGTIYSLETVANVDAVATIMNGTLELEFEAMVDGEDGNSILKESVSSNLSWDAGTTFTGGE